MPQQINILTPVLLTQKRYLSAYNLLRVLALLMLCVGSLYGYLIWDTGVATNELKKTSSLKLRELENLQAAIKKNSMKGSATGTVLMQVQSQRAELLRIEKIIATLQQGATRAGYSHAARFELLAKTIPTNVWITQFSDEEKQLQITGFTFDPALLETWIARLIKNPVLLGQTLQAVKVENVNGGLQVISRPMWSFSFTLASSRPVMALEVKP